MFDPSSTLVQRLRWLPIAIGAIWLAVGWINIILQPRGDFPHHWEQGRRLLSGEFIYEGGLNAVYPPFWALVHAPLAVLDQHVAQIAAYPLVFLALAVLLWVLHQLTKDHLPLDRDRLFWATTIVVVLSSHFLSRDLPEVGVNTALVSLTWLAIYLWSRGHDWPAGISLGLAGALKCTPLLFIAYFALKRQWKMVATSTVAFGIFTASPILVLGSDQYVRAMKFWGEVVVHGVNFHDPSRGPLGEDKVENLALRPALARYLMHLPYGHLGRPESSDTAQRPHQPPTPLYLHFGNLSPHSAGIVATTIMGSFLVGVGWLFRREIIDRRDHTVLWECALVSLLMLLYSPLTWKQHAVGVLPALYLICRFGWTGRLIPSWIITAVVLYAILVLPLNREFIGRDLVKLLDSYHVKTIALLVLVGATWGCRRIMGCTLVRSGLARRSGVYAD